MKKMIKIRKKRLRNIHNNLNHISNNHLNGQMNRNILINN